MEWCRMPLVQQQIKSYTHTNTSSIVELNDWRPLTHQLFGWYLKASQRNQSTNSVGNLACYNSSFTVDSWQKHSNSYTSPPRNTLCVVVWMPPSRQLSPPLCTSYVLRYSLCFAHNNSFEQGKFFFRLNLNVTKRWKRPKEVEKKTTVLGKVRSKSFNCDMVKLLCLPLETPTIVLTYERRRQALIVVKYLYL